ncbi:MAG: STAS-like domain-containing protein [Candidatus Omnitrophica bacterium]|nr:STAS-like domain-containing protein [Candidatus Omnitrophota bacterium]
MIKISILNKAGSFAENKDIARDIRLKDLVPALENSENIILDFAGVDAANQSFIHALISDLLRKYGILILDRIEFKSCNAKVRKIIEIVTEYMQEGMK